MIAPNPKDEFLIKNLGRLGNMQGTLEAGLSLIKLNLIATSMILETLIVDEAVVTH